MIPQIISLGPIPINSFGLMVALSLLAGVYQLSKSFERAGLPVDLAERYVFTSVIVGLIGARLFYLIEYYDDIQHDLVGAIFSSAGFTFYGGFILSAVVIYIMARKDKLPLVKFVDSVGPTLALGYAIGRLGCQLSGDGDYGIATTSWLGMSYETGVIPTPPGILVFPTPFYESAISLMILYFLLKVEMKASWSKPFAKFGLYLALMGVERFLVEFLRVNPRYTFGFSEAQYIALGLILLGLTMLFNLKRGALSNEFN